jgi:2-oxoglutarate ferredoxin oxidoreductase subunit gamma
MAKAKNGSKKKTNFSEDRYEIRLSGSGGQGLITAGVILAEAVSVGDGKNAVHTQSYGPEARGGRTRCDVIISKGDIYFPEATKLDLLLSLTQESADAYSPLLKNDGFFIIDSDYVTQKPERLFIEVPFTEKTREKLGSAVATNVVCLGFITQLTNIVTKKSIEKFLVERFPERFKKSNLKAINLGYEMARKYNRSNASCGSEELLETEIDRL